MRGNASLSHSSKMRRALKTAAVTLAFAVGAGLAPVAASAEIDVWEFTTGMPGSQAGSTSDFNLGYKVTAETGNITGVVKDQVFDLPKGFVADPTIAQMCDAADVFFRSPNRCGTETTVGMVSYKLINPVGAGVVVPTTFRSRLRRMVPHEGEAAAFGIVAQAQYPIRFSATVGPESDYRVRVTSRNQQATLPLYEAEATMWGVPADFQGPGAYNELGETGITFGGPLAGAQRKRFASVPARCDGQVETSMRVASWEHRVLLPALLSSFAAPTGCEGLIFNPALSVTPSVSQAATPSGYRVVLNIGQSSDVANPRTPNLKDAVVKLPEGVVISPAAAHGLEACTDEQLMIDNSEAEKCPAASKIGDVVVESPVLDETVNGSIYTASQLSDDPDSGDMFRIFLTADTSGVKIKLRGQVAVDPNTGQITTRFLDNPDLPFERMTLTFKDGDRAPLSNPMGCGGFNTLSTFSSWAGQSVDTTSPMSIDGACEQHAFAPTLSAGSTDPIASAHSTFVLSSTKASGGADLNGVTVDLPKGLLATLKGNLGQQVGTVRVAAGLGAYPFELPGTAVLEGAYGDAPYSLRVTVPAKAGPFDLGEVVVRQKVYIDSETAQVRIVSDPFPTVVKGVPVRLQRLAVSIDKRGFMFNPTSCDPKSIDATFKSPSAADVGRSARFKVADCGSLEFQPKIAMRLTGKGQTRTGRHPGLRSILTQPAGEGSANIAKARVVLPKSVVLDPNNSTDPALVCDYDKGLAADCPASSIIGKATANSPVLERPLTGNVHMVQGIRFGPTGNRIRTTPSLLVKLRGEVDINVRAKTSVSGGKLVTTFPEVPDAPVAKFRLDINGGRKGILVVTRTRKAKINVCNARQTANVQTDGHNGRTRDFKVNVKRPCTKASKSKASKKR
jgi:hypothetical protein